MIGLKKLFYKVLIWINRIINRNAIKNKVFCIGLHKTGTTSLHHLAIQFGYKSIHSTDWMHDKEKIEKFDFFSDGGSHFDNLNEFDYQYLCKEYPTSKFILQTRDTKSWIKSKLSHAGWNTRTVIEQDDPEKFDWTYKSLETISRLVHHKFRYEQKVRDYFNENFPDRFIVTDITRNERQFEEITRIQNFLRVSSIFKIKVPHKNRSQSKSLPKQAEKMIDKILK